MALDRHGLPGRLASGHDGPLTVALGLADQAPNDGAPGPRYRYPPNVPPGRATRFRTSMFPVSQDRAATPARAAD